jgi:hypothetical protein
MQLIAIDVGKSGGLAVGTPDSTGLYKMPQTEGDILALLTELHRPGETVCYVELVPTGMPNRGAACVKLNANAAFLRGCIMSLKMRLILVRPVEWQGFFNLGKRNTCQNDREWKNKLKAEAQRRYPSLTITHQTADALLILEWARATHERPTSQD